MRIYLRVAFGLLLLGALVWHFDISALLREARAASTPWVAAATAAIAASTLIGAWNRHLLVSIEEPVTFSRFLPLYWTAWAFGLVIPGNVGDVAALGALLRRRGIAWSRSIGRSLLDKLISLALMAAISLFGLLAVLGAGRPEGTLAMLGAAAALGTGAAGALLLRPSLRGRLDPARPGLLGGLARTLAELAVAGRYPRRIAANAILSVASIVLIGTSYWCMFMALGYTEAGWDRVVPLVSVCSLVAYVPVTFNGLGTVEMAGVFVFGRIGVPGAAVLTAILCLRLIVIALAWIPAAAWLALARRAEASTGPRIGT